MALFRELSFDETSWFEAWGAAAGEDVNGDQVSLTTTSTLADEGLDVVKRDVRSDTLTQSFDEAMIEPERRFGGRRSISKDGRPLSCHDRHLIDQQGAERHARLAVGAWADDEGIMQAGVMDLGEQECRCRGKIGCVEENASRLSVSVLLAL